MSSMIQIPSDITVSKVEFGPVKLLDSGGKTVNVRYEGRNLMVETPSLSVPYGLNVFDKQPGAPPKFSIDLSLRGADESAQVRAFQDFLEAFDERMVDAGVENASAWFKMAKPNREVIKAFYTPVVKVSRDASGNPKPYPPTFKLAFRKRLTKGVKDSSTAETPAHTRLFETEFYNSMEKDAKGQVALYPGDSLLEKVLCKRTSVSAIVQCTGIWFAGGKFGTTWKAVQMRVDSQPEQIRGPAFRTDAPDIRAFVEKALPSAGAGSGSGSGAGYGGEDEDDDDAAADEEVVAAVLPAKKTVAAPAPAPAAFDDEDVVEPVPVPAKKVVKKVVTSVKKA
jgi:hypothetical protein